MQEQMRIGEKIKIFTTPVKNWLEHTYYAQYPNLFLWSPIFLGIGIFIYFCLPSEPPLIIFIIGFFIYYALYKYFIEPAPYEIVRILFYAASFAYLGIACATFRTAYINAPILTKNTKAVNVIGNIDSIELLEENKGARLVLSKLDIEHIERADTPHKIRVTTRNYQNLYVGQRIKALAKLNAPSAPLHPDGFNFRRYLFFQQIGATGFIYSAPEILKEKRVGFSFADLRHNLATRLVQSLPEEQSSIAIALITGFKHKISKENYEMIRDAGLAHMLAISGLHIGLICGSVFFVMRFIFAVIPGTALHLPIKNIAAFTAICAGMFYMLLAGSTPPTQRAVIMSSVFFLAITLNRSPISLRMIAIAALIVLIIRPESLINASFQMSFAAVTCLVYFYDRSRSLWQKAYQKQGIANKVSLYCLSLCLTTLIASIATAPFSLYHFGEVSILGSIANFFAVPILSLWIMPAALVSLFAMPLHLDHVFLWLMGQGIQAVVEIASWASKLPHATMQIPQFSNLSFATIISAALCFMLIKTKMRYAMCTLCLLILLTHGRGYQKADLLISDTYKLVAYYDKKDEKIYSSSTRKERFVLENWAHYFGADIDDTRTLTQNTPCDEEGCRITLKDYNVSFIYTLYILREECEWADVILSDVPIDKSLCPDKIVIDKYDTIKNGYYALQFKNNDLKIENNSSEQKDRPWSLYPRYKSAFEKG